ncbi:Phage gp6-like head-tail connector protein [Pseudovibrio axinellae]|uniref:Phage gp6-like head-tail connector protein n=1 Tax=Pseudovibrio axinellae TaxID=989403 RepID=A0A165SVY2_9HYPH|nr:head-tail connector protein [Pseudovibrio axinellae]KZL04546.1 Phage gp6-like head-tail connector protein [Pseudovibrio axinellae]SEQ73568.1 uncharacterized phage protein (possible DNA packaging) [Pseudovibrio axinellae]
MSLIELEEVKQHLSISHSYDDVLLTSLIRTAETYAGRYLRCDFGVEFPDGVAEPIKTALSIHIHALYRGRSGETSTGTARLPPGYEVMMAPYRNLAG